jgi:rhamnulokinase
VTRAAVAAVDLGASTGRVTVAEVGPRTLKLREVHRFPNGPVTRPDGLHWDTAGLHREILTGLRAAARMPDPPRSVGIDSWGVDYALLDERGALLDEPFHYRDGRTAREIRRVHRAIPRSVLYASTGIQFLAFNTIYQLAADRRAGRLERARHFAMIPDLFAYHLTGVLANEVTNASTTGLYRAEEPGGWLTGPMPGLFPERLFQEPRRPGETVGPLRDDVVIDTGLPASTEVTLVGSHDTASAVVAVPADGERFAYIACGTWSLVGVELDAPILTEASRRANFTNEAGVDGRIRYLRNVMGLWLLQESLRTWQRDRPAVDLDALLAAAADVPAGGPMIDPDDPAFLPPADMPARIAAACREAGEAVPATKPEVVRCILDSLARSHAAALRDAMRLSRQDVDVVHLVGGGARNALLCQLTANACQCPVVAGPVEATSIGNVLVQARAAGAIRGDLSVLRRLVRTTQELRRFEPRLRS